MWEGWCPYIFVTFLKISDIFNSILVKQTLICGVIENKFREHITKKKKNNNKAVITYEASQI